MQHISQKPSSNHHLYNDPIAIVGMSCRFPQAPTLEAFWERLVHRHTALSYEGHAPDKAETMLENIHDFDAHFFGISPAEACEMIAEEKLVLELVWEALENAAIPLKNIQNQHTGVYLGYVQPRLPSSLPSFMPPPHKLAHRISHHYALSGPSRVVNKGDTSSLLALHMACQDLWLYDLPMAIAGGVTLLPSRPSYDSGCCAWGEALWQEQSLRSEGAGILVLKKQSQAERDGDKIYAVIHHSAALPAARMADQPASIASDQSQILSEVYERSGVRPKEIDYVETYSTSPYLSNASEIALLNAFFRPGHTTSPLHIGSIKTPLGHLEAASGIAGLIKVVLAMEHQQLPPAQVLHTRESTPHDQRHANPWHTAPGKALKAGVHAIGRDGTQIHVILAAPSTPTAPIDTDKPQPNRYCLPLGAQCTAALTDYAQAYHHYLQQITETMLPSICKATALQKPGFAYRKLFTADTRTALLQRLEHFIKYPTEVRPCTADNGPKRLVMVFGGSGISWCSVGHELLAAEPVFREAMDACIHAFQPFLNWSFTDQVIASPMASETHRIDVMDPICCAIQIALARWWMSWGMVPQAVIGYGMGEVAAAHIAGALTLTDAARIICTRSQLLATLRNDDLSMAVAALSPQEAQALTRHYPEITVARYNSYRSTVLTGERNLLQTVLNSLAHQGIFCRPLAATAPPQGAAHAALQKSMQEMLHTLTPVETTIPLYSTTRQHTVSGTMLTADYWVDNACQPIKFAAVVETLIRHHHQYFIEISTHPSLVHHLIESAYYVKKDIVAVASLVCDKPGRETLYHNLEELYGQGYMIAWAQHYGTLQTPHVILPPYPFQRKHHTPEESGLHPCPSVETALTTIPGNPVKIAAAESTVNFSLPHALPFIPPAYHTEWIKHPGKVFPATTMYKRKTWIVFGDPYGYSELLEERMAPQMIDCIHVTPGKIFCCLYDSRYAIQYDQGNDYVRLFQEIFNNPVHTRIDGILHMGSVSIMSQETFFSTDELQEKEIFGSLSLLHTIQALQQVMPSVAPSLAIATNGVHPVDGDGMQPIHSSLWGLSKVLPYELPAYPSRYIDLSPTPTTYEFDLLLHMLHEQPVKEPVMALRGMTPYIPKLTPLPTLPNHQAQPKHFSATGTYLVLGIQKIAFALIKWMMSRGARHFVVVHAHTAPLPKKIIANIIALKKEGADVQVIEANVAHYTEAVRVLHNIDQSPHPLRGVVHADVPLKKLSLMKNSPRKLLDTLQPQINSAWNLHLLTLRKKLECYILCSSSNTPSEPHHLGVSEAANAFLDMLAYHRKQLGLPGMTVSTPPVTTPSIDAPFHINEQPSTARIKQTIQTLNSHYDHTHVQLIIPNISLSGLVEDEIPFIETGVSPRLFENLTLSSEKIYERARHQIEKLSV